MWSWGEWDEWPEAELVDIPSHSLYWASDDDFLGKWDDQYGLEGLSKCGQRGVEERELGLANLQDHDLIESHWELRLAVLVIGEQEQQLTVKCW